MAVTSRVGESKRVSSGWKNLTEKIFREKVNKKILEKITRKMTRKIIEKMTEKMTEKTALMSTSRRSKNHWKIIALWSIFYRFFCHFFGHFFGRKTSSSSKTKFSTLHKIATSKKSTSLDEKNDSIKPHIWGWGVKFLKKRPCGALFLPTCTTPPPVIIFFRRGLDRNFRQVKKFCIPIYEKMHIFAKKKKSTLYHRGWYRGRKMGFFCKNTPFWGCFSS